MCFGLKNMINYKETTSMFTTSEFHKQGGENKPFIWSSLELIHQYTCQQHI